MNQVTNIVFSAEKEPGKPATENKSTAVRVGHIVSVSGPQAVAVVDRVEGGLANNARKRIEIGSLITVPTPGSSVVGIVSGMTTPMPGNNEEKIDEVLLVEISLAGEIQHDKKTQAMRFNRGVTHFPTIGDPIMRAGRDELSCVYYQPDASTIDVGTLHQDSSVPAHFLVDELFGKHFIVVGTTWSGKSSAIICILRRLFAEHAHAHILMLDVHNEYANAFGDKAECVHPSNLRLPFWLLNFQELCAAFAGVDGHRDAEVEIFSDAVLAARRRFFESQLGRIKRSGEGAGLTVDTPSPFRLADVVSYLEEQLGKLERAHAALPYRRLKGRIEAMVADPRFSFMFGSYTVEDTMADVLGRLFRVPINGKPITVVDLASVPPEILDIVVSLIARLAFDFSVWSEGAVPMLIVCEEAHRYAPASTSEKFMPTRYALSRIAKEGRKYGVSLALVTQRPSELDPTIISQCSTAIALRLSTDRDQEVMRATTHDGAFDLLDYLPLLGDREAIILGQGVPMPMRILFHHISDLGVPQQRKAGFSASWRKPNMDRKGLEQVVSRWRSIGRPRQDEPDEIEQ